MTWASNSRLTFKLSSVLEANEFVIDGAMLTEFARAPEYDESGRYMVGVRTRLAGRALLTGTTAVQYAAFRTMAIAAKDAGDPVQYTMEVRIPGGAWVVVDDWTNEVTDNAGGPHVDLSAPAAFGVYGLAIEFVVEKHAPPQALADALPAVAHTWTQTVELDNMNRIARTVRGVLKVAPAREGSTSVIPAPSGASADWKGRYPYADLFRMAVVPALVGENWRRESASWLVGKDSLTYEIKDTQHRKPTPWPARTAEYSFRYERGYPEIGFANCLMRVSLSGELDVGTRELLVAAWNMTKIRVAPSGTIIRKMSVEERNMGSEVSVDCEVAFQVYATNDETTPTGTLPLAAFLGKDWTVDNSLTESTPMNPYGHYGGAYWMDNDWIDSTLSAMKDLASAPDMVQAEAYLVVIALPSTTPCTITGIASTTLLTEMNANFGGAYAQPFPVQPTTGAGAFVKRSPITASKASSTIEYRGGLIRMCSAENAAADAVYQVEKPYAHVEERLEVSRANQEPPKALRPVPTGAMNVRETFVAHGGNSDAQGNRVWLCEFVRTYQLLDPGTATLGWSTVSGRRVWTPPEGYFLCGYTPALDTDSQTSLVSVLGVTTDKRQQVVAVTSGLVT